MRLFIHFETANGARVQRYLQWLVPIMFSLTFLVYLLTQIVPSGVNGYFYLKQIKYFFETGQLYFQDRSLAFSLPFLLRYFLPTDLLAYHLSVGFLLTAFCVLQGRMALRLANSFMSHSAAPMTSPLTNTFLIVLLLTVLFFTHPHILFFGLNFYKNLFAVVFVLLGIDQYFVFTATNRKRFLAMSILAFVVAVLAHKSSLILCGAWLAAVFAFHFQKQRKVLLLLPVLFLLLFGAFLFYFPKASAYISYLKSGFHFSTDYVLWLKSQTRLGNFIFGGYITLAVLAGYLIASFKTAKMPFRVYAVWMFCVLLFALLPIHSIGQNQLGYRWLLMSLGLSLPLVAAVCVRYRFVGGILLGLHLGQWMYAVPLHRYFLDFQRHQTDFEQITKFVDSEDYLIAHHGLEFYIDYTTGLRARIFLPETKPANGDVFRIVHVPFGALRWQPLRIAVNQRALLRINREYFLLTETQWLDARKAAIFPPESWQNPMDKNPGHVYQ
jgi:hypothetical protein